MAGKSCQTRLNHIRFASAPNGRRQREIFFRNTDLCRIVKTFHSTLYRACVHTSFVPSKARQGKQALESKPGDAQSPTAMEPIIYTSY